MTANQINFYKAQTERMHYDRSDAEMQRHNYASEAISREANAIQSWFNEQQAAHLIRADAINASHYDRMDTETARHNAEEEKIQHYNVRLGYEKLPIEQQKADASTTSAEAAERNAATNAFLSFGTADLNYARVANVTTETQYLPDYRKAQTFSEMMKAVNFSTQSAANIVKSIPVVGLFVK